MVLTLRILIGNNKMRLSVPAFYQPFPTPYFRSSLIVRIHGRYGIEKCSELVTSMDEYQDWSCQQYHIVQSCLICNLFLFVNYCSFVKLVWFLDDNKNEINMHVLNKSIRVHSYFIYQYQTFVQANSKENDEIKYTRSLSVCFSRKPC